MQVKKQQFDLDIEQKTGYRLRNEYGKAVYHHPPYLTYMQNTSFEMLGWMKYKLGSKYPGEKKKNSRRNINKLTYADDNTVKAERKELKSLLMKVQQESQNTGLKLNTQKTKIMASRPITLW